MSMITEQIEYLIKLSDTHPFDSNIPTLQRACKEAADTIEQLAAKVRPKTGHWITKIKSDLSDDMWPTNPKCSECGGELYYSNTIYNYKFCPYCGAKMRKENRMEEAKDRQENTIDKILTFIDAEVWAYIDYLKKQERFSGDLGDHINCLSENIRERLREELPDILSTKYEKAFMDGFESHPTHHAYQKAFEDIRKEIVDATKCIYGKCIGSKCPSDTDCMIMGEHAIEIINKHNPDKVGKERE